MTNITTQLYNDNLKLIREIHKRDVLIQLLMSRLENKIRRNKNG